MSKELLIDAEEVSTLKVDRHEAGVLMTVRDANDEPRYYKNDKSKPMQVRVRSHRSSAVKALSLRLQKRTTALNKGRRNADQTIPNDDFLAAHAAAMGFELHHFHGDVAVQTPDEDALVQFYRQVRFEDIRDQVWEFGRNDANYDEPGEAGKNVDAAPAALSTSES